MTPTRYRVLSPRQVAGGKQVSVFAEATGDLQAQAAAAGTPLSVFIEEASMTEVRLRAFTPQREKGESDSATVAALASLQAAGGLSDLVEVQTGAAVTSAQWCGGEWLLNQGSPQVEAVERLDLPDPLGSNPSAAHRASTGRPNLLLEVDDLNGLQNFQPDAERISALGRATNTTGLVLYCRAAPAELGRADLSFRAFGPLKGFLEDAASSNMCACLVAVLGERGLWPEDSFVLRAAQLQPGQPSLLTAQFSQPGEAVWVGGRAEVVRESQS
ncbi:MAG: PhzF family phenazine biosynthesis protein [Deinococcus sp.]|uniref:PhzF family phenazine biosynthesis protein n=1 Tax=Deinococcus sp. TaxID=47478 RepID=UPI0026DBC409|nr:PhzF family phenazine biosynthesis protein [Deinococcus sp.]MDO4246247.1 PhzF family phenazine biosynthesis protein [Deinococcus sp.]